MKNLLPVSSLILQSHLPLRQYRFVILYFRGGISPSEDTISEATHEGGVESILGFQASHHSIGNTLGYHSQPYSHPSYHVRHSAVHLVLGEPRQDGDLGLHALLALGPSSLLSSSQPGLGNTIITNLTDIGRIIPFLF